MIGRVKYSPGPSAERNQLLILAAGLLIVGASYYWFADGIILPMFFVGIASLALAGGIAYEKCGRPVFLLFALLSSFIGRVVSTVIIAVIYFCTILVFGSVLRLFGMNKLERKFSRCRLRESMFVDAPMTDAESFRRQS